MATISNSIRQRVASLMKTAAEESAKEKPKDDKKSPFMSEKDKKKKENEKESMGTAAHGGYDTSGMSDSSGMTVTAGDLTSQLDKAASALDYCASHFHQIIDDRSVEEKVAELAAYSAEYQKMAMEGGGYSAEGCQMENTLDKDQYQKQEQPTPHRGKKMAPNETPVSAMGEFPNNYKDDRTSESWDKDPAHGKKASVSRFLQRRGQLKTANPAMGGAPAPAPAAPAPAAAPPAAAPPQGPDPMMVAQQLQQQGQLTPESLSQAAGVSPEEAAAIIASLSGGTGAPAPAPAPAPGAPAAGGMAPAGAPGGAGAGGMEVQASADPSAIFQSALRKYAGEDVSPAKISAPKSDMRPEDEDVKHRQMPGLEGIASNEAAMAFTAQQGRKPRDEAVSAWLNRQVPYKAESGYRQGGVGKMDEFIGDKTSSAKLASVRRRLRSRVQNPSA